MHHSASAIYIQHAWDEQALKQRLVERANIIQGRRNDEAATLVRREVRINAKRGLLSELGH